jgi:hypothetical protein
VVRAGRSQRSGCRFDPCRAHHASPFGLRVAQPSGGRRAKRGVRRSLGAAKAKTDWKPRLCQHPSGGSQTKISKTTPCKVTGRSPAWMLPLRKPFDTSGKSAAQFHHRAICKAADGAAHRALGAMTSQKSRQLKISPARPRRMIACVLPYRARLHPRGLRRFRRERNSRPDPHVSGPDRDSQPPSQQWRTCHHRAVRVGDGDKAIVGNGTRHASVIVSDNNGANALTDARMVSMPDRDVQHHDPVDAKRKAQP